MKKLTSILALLLCLVICLAAFASCGKKKPASTTANEATTTADGTPTATTTSKWDEIGEAVSAYASSDRTLRIQYDMFVSAENIPQNDKYIQGPDEVVVGTTSAIEEKVYNRNREAAELLGVTLEYSYWDDLKWGAQEARIRTLVDGSDPDAPDLYIDMLYDLNKAMRTAGVFKDLWSIPGSYFDFTTKGWMTEWMKSLSFTEDRAYILGGDYFLELFRAMGVLPFNINLMDANAAKLAALFLPATEQLGADEELSVRFFDLVEQGHWTWDGLGKLCEAIWVDTDGSGDNTVGDLLGIITDKYTGLPSSLIVYSAGVTLTETYTIEDESSEYNGLKWMRYYDNSALLGSVFDAVANVFNGKGAFVTNYVPGETSETLATNYAKFASDELLFAGPVLLGALEDKSFQEMTSIWSVVPIPKVNNAEGSVYNTVIHNTADVGAISVKTTPDKARALSAFLQYCNENSTEIREEFQQIVTKFKTTTYNQGTDRMLDIIYDSVITGRDKAIEDVAELTSGNSSSSWMKKQGFTSGSDYVASQYKSQVSKKQDNMDKILKQWYTLPTSATETQTDTDTSGSAE